MAQRKNAVVGLDVGTTKICAVVAEPGTNGNIKILGTGSSPSKGLQKGVVVDIERTVDSIDQERGIVKVIVTIFGRSTPLDIEYWQIEKI